eukprot:COSAG02_NODE_588_length_19902_cov_115.928900_20_plen_97_part_00
MDCRRGAHVSNICTQLPQVEHGLCQPLSAPKRREGLPVVPCVHDIFPEKYALYLFSVVAVTVASRVVAPTTVRCGLIVVIYTCEWTMQGSDVTSQT